MRKVGCSMRPPATKFKEESMMESKTEIGKTIFGIDFSMATDLFVVLMIVIGIAGYLTGLYFKKRKK